MTLFRYMTMRIIVMYRNPVYTLSHRGRGGVCQDVPRFVAPDGLVSISARPVAAIPSIISRGRWNDRQGVRLYAAYATSC